jgi:type II secretory pathway pseudopilin PulG
METVVVLLLFGLLAAVGVPNLLRAKIRSEMLSQVKMTQQAFAVSRIHAIKRGRPVAVSMEDVGGKAALVAWEDENENEVHDSNERNLGTWIYPEKFNIDEFPSMEFYHLQSRLGGSGPPGALFLPSGSAILAQGTTSPTGQAAILFQDNVGNQIRLRVLSGTGTMIQEMKDPESDYWDAHSTKYWRY